MSIALVQQVAVKTTSGGSATKNVTIATPAAGSALRLLTYGAGAITISSVTGGGVTWSQLSTVVNTGSNAGLQLWGGDNSSGSGTTIAITLANTYNTIEVNVSEWSGMPTTVVPDGAPTTNTGTSITTTSASLTPTAGKEVLLLASGAAGTTVDSSSVSGSFTALTRSATATTAAFAYRIVASASGSYSTGWTNAVSYQSWCSIIAGWDGAAAATGRGTIIGGGMGQLLGAA